VIGLELWALRTLGAANWQREGGGLLPSLQAPNGPNIGSCISCAAENNRGNGKSSPLSSDLSFDHLTIVEE